MSALADYRTLQDHWWSVANTGREGDDNATAVLFFCQKSLWQVLHFFRPQQDPQFEGIAHDFSPNPCLLIFLLLRALKQRQAKGTTVLRYSQLSTAYTGGTLDPWLHLPFSICTKKWKKENTDKIFQKMSGSLPVKMDNEGFTGCGRQLQTQDFLFHPG